MDALKIYKIIILTLIALVSYAHAEPTWTVFTGNFPEGTPPIVNVISSDEDSTVVEITTPGMWEEEVEIDGMTFQKIEIPEYGFTYEIGLPQIPGVRELVAVPGMKDIFLNVVETKTIEREEYNVYPVQTPLVDGDNGNGEFDYDEEFYQTDALYPENLTDLGGASIWRDVRVVNPSLYPVRFNPAQQKLEVAYYIKFELVYSGESNDNVKIDPDYPIEKKYADTYSENITNYDFLDLQEISWALEDLDYLIITAPGFVGPANRIRDWARTRGYGAETVDTNTAGDTWQEIWDYLKTLYANERMDYVLLLGDIGDYNDLVPIAKISVVWEDTITDYRYSLLEGDDPFPEVAVSRLCGTTVDELNHQIDKITDYNAGIEPGPWAQRGLLVAHQDYEWDYRGYRECKEKLRTNAWEYFDPVFIKCYGADDGVTNKNIKLAIDGGCGIVNYRGHGGTDKWANWSKGPGQYSWTTVNIHEDLNNGDKYPVVFNICCLNAELDNAAREETLCEAWLSSEYGAVAALGSTRVSWTPTNNIFDWELFSQIYRLGRTELGLINNDARGCFIKFHHEGDIRGTASLFQFVLLGEPTTDIRTGPLLGLYCMHVESVPVAVATPVQIEVKDNVNLLPIADAVVCLYKDGEVHEAYTTGSNGLISFDVTAATTGEITVTVRKHGFIPYEGSIAVE